MRTLRSASVAISVAMALAVPAASCTMPVPEPSPRTVVEKRFAAVARHDVEAIAALYAPNAVETSPAFCTARKGPDGARRTYGDLFRDFPGITTDEPVYLVQGNRVAVQFLARVRKVDGSVAFEIALANFLTVERGHITRDETYFDTRGRPCS